MSLIVLLYVALCLVLLFGRRLTVCWARLWYAVILNVYLGRPWRVAWDRARRRIS